MSTTNPKKPNVSKNTNGVAAAAATVAGTEDKISNASSGAGDGNGDKKGDFFSNFKVLSKIIIIVNNKSQNK